MGLRHMSSQYTLDNLHVKEVQITTYYLYKYKYGEVQEIEYCKYGKVQRM